MATQGAAAVSKFSWFPGALLPFAGAALASAILLTELVPALTISHTYLVAFSLASLAITAFQWARSPNVVDPRAGLLATFLPAVPLSLAVLYFDGFAAGSHLLAATAFAFQARRWLQASVERSRVTRASWAKALEDRFPKVATVFVDNDIQSEVSAASLREGHIFRLAPGQVVPADGMVTFGSSFVDESLVAGAPEQLEIKGMGSMVYAGSLNKNGSLLVRASAVGEQTFSARLAARIRAGTEFSFLKLLAVDSFLTAIAAVALAFGGPASALRVFLVASSTSCFAVLYAFEARLAESSVLRRRLWAPGALRKTAGAGMIVAPAAGVVTQGRLKLSAMECAGRMSEEAALALIGPVARKMESQAAFAVLQELRQRNIPLQQAEFFQLGEGVCTALVAGEEIGWLQVEAKSSQIPGGPLGAFVRDHLNGGDEVCLLMREGGPQAALAFRDEPVKDSAEAAELLRSISQPLLLVSPLPKSCLARMQTELGLEHAQGEAGPEETEVLVSRLAAEKLAPAWVSPTPFRPKAAEVVISLPHPGQTADLILTQLSLPSLARTLREGRRSFQLLRLGLGWMISLQLGLLALLLAADSRFAAVLHLGSVRTVSEGSLALAGVLPGLVAALLLRTHAPESV